MQDLIQQQQYIMSKLYSVVEFIDIVAGLIMLCTCILSKIMVRKEDNPLAYYTINILFYLLSIRFILAIGLWLVA